MAYTAGETRAALGYWRYTGRFHEITPVLGCDGATRRGNAGTYLVLERRLTYCHRLASSENREGLAAFLQLGVTDASINPIARYMGGGLVYTGLFRKAGDDRVGVTIARAEFGEPYRRRAAIGSNLADKAETVVELTYRTPLVKWLTVQPDLQYIRNPGIDPAL